MGLSASTLLIRGGQLGKLERSGGLGSMLIDKKQVYQGRQFDESQKIYHRSRNRDRGFGCRIRALRAGHDNHEAEEESQARLRRKEFL
jgi:hypothetical protein